MDDFSARDFVQIKELDRFDRQRVADQIIVKKYPVYKLPDESKNIGILVKYHLVDSIMGKYISAVFSKDGQQEEINYRTWGFAQDDKIGNMYIKGSYAQKISKALPYTPKDIKEQQKQNGSDREEKPLSTRERNNLLKIIYILSRMNREIDIGGANAVSAVLTKAEQLKEIESAPGDKLSDDLIRDKFDDACILLRIENHRKKQKKS